MFEYIIYVEWRNNYFLIIKRTRHVLSLESGQKNRTSIYIHYILYGCVIVITNSFKNFSERAGFNSITGKNIFSRFLESSTLKILYTIITYTRRWSRVRLYIICEHLLSHIHAHVKVKTI